MRFFRSLPEGAWMPTVANRLRNLPGWWLCRTSFWLSQQPTLSTPGSGLVLAPSFCNCAIFARAAARGVFHISRDTPTATRPVRRRREEQGLHILADAAEGVLPSGQSPDERQELMARHFVDPPQLANGIAVLVDA